MDWDGIVGFEVCGRIYDPRDVRIIRILKEGETMPDLKLIETAKREVFEYAMRHLDKTDEIGGFTIENVYVVWFCKILQNWKALASTDLLDGTYYEVTFDGVTGSIFLDVYKKFDNIEILAAGGNPLANLESLRKDWAQAE